MAETQKRIVALTSLPGRGFSINLEDRQVAVRVTPNEGDVLLAEGDGPDRLDRVCIPGRSVIRFGVQPLGDGAEIYLLFEAVDGDDRHLLGVSDTFSCAKHWVDAVNEIYLSRWGREVGVKKAGWTDSLQPGRVCTDIFEVRGNIVLPGDYVYSADLTPPHVPVRNYVYDGKEFPRTGLPSWQDLYIRYCMDEVIERSGSRGPYTIALKNTPSHDYSWIADRVKYPSVRSQVRITQPLELMFDREQRHEKIGIVPYGTVPRFALVYVRGQAVADALGLRSQEIVAPSFDSWITKISEAMVKGKRLLVCTPVDQSPHYSLKDAVFQNKIEAEQHESRSSPVELGRWLEDWCRFGVIACDIGVAYQIMNSMRSVDRPIVDKVDFALVPYESPVPAGVCYRADDPDWGKVCSISLWKCLTSKDDGVAESLSVFNDKAQQVGVDIGLQPSLVGAE